MANTQEYVTKKDLAVFGENLAKQITDDIAGVFQDFAEKVDKRFDGVEERLDRVEVRLEAVEERLETVEMRLIKVEHEVSDLKIRMDQLEASHQQLVSTIDKFLKRLDDIETENAARDHQYARLERWVEQIAKQTGIKLEY